MKEGKKQKAAKAQVDPQKQYPLEEAVALASQLKHTRFDESMDIAMRLGVDPKHADQMVRGSVVLPNGTGKAVRVLALTKGEKEAEAKAAGADYVGCDEYVQKIQEGWLEFDALVATPDVMGQVGRLGKILGPRGLMPSPKTGSVTMDIGKAVSDLKAGKVEYRVDKAGNIHSVVGKSSFPVDKLIENARVFIDAVVRAKPAAAKGQYVRRVAISTTMGPGIKVDHGRMVADTKH
ncbi:MAG: 50S ribosomal protein L1 [candidate division Zixibacteria bacterium]|nr:50S ribosomal protein L1 [candidate division Zixibacteria bacterium]